MLKRLAWGLAALCVAVAGPTIALLVLGAARTTPPDGFGLTGLGGLAFLVAFLAYSTIGALIVSRLPNHRVGWLFCAIGVAGTVGNFAYQYADYTVYVSPEALPGAGAAAWLQNLALPPVFGLLAMSLLLFPDGKLASTGWRPALGAACLGVIGVVAGYTFAPGPVEFPFESVMNPLGIASLRAPMQAATAVGWLLMAASAGLGGIAITLRLRRSRGAERQQLKWIALVGSMAGVVLVLNAASFFLPVGGIEAMRIILVGLTFAALPVASGVAILRYRLYDIDVVINKTLVYLGVTVALAAVYLGAVLLLQLMLRGVTSDSALATAGSTLLAAAAAQPVRRRVQSGVDRRFYRSKYDAVRTIELFGTRMRDEVDLDALRGELRAVVIKTMQPSAVSLWLRPTERR